LEQRNKENSLKKQSFKQVHVQNKKHQKKMQNICKTENTKKNNEKKNGTASQGRARPRASLSPADVRGLSNHAPWERGF
jgi:hypothetical protein